MMSNAEQRLTRGGQARGPELPSHVGSGASHEERLESDAAFKALCSVAARWPETSFLSKLRVVFGSDLPTAAYQTLRKSLLDKTLALPRIELVTSGLMGHEAGYDNARRVIMVDRQLVSLAERDRSRAATLLVALVEEFGHHVDNLLRTEFSRQGGDGPRDEGTELAFTLYTQWQAPTPTNPFATYTRAGRTHRLSTDTASFKRALRRHTSEQDRADDAKAGPVQFFGAGRGHGKAGKSFGHESIEDALESSFPSREQRRQIYFGNWLRDYSQAIDPALIRPVGSKNISEGFTRDALTRVLDVLAREEFGNVPMFAVTPQKLGVYRPEEHIDNPHGIEDKSGDDKDFRKKCTEAEVDIDKTTGMLNYIANRKGNWATSSAYIEQELCAAAAIGNTPEGLRRLGHALHTLEDFYAHSNFVELLLIKLGYGDVYPWAHRKFPAPTPRYPLVTGKFGSNDIQVSLAYVLNEKVTAKAGKMYVAGERSTSAKILLILAKDIPPEELDPKHVRMYERYLTFMEDFSRENPRLGKALDDISKLLSALPNSILASRAKNHAMSVTKSQQEFLKNPAFLHPTHSQLAKDHDDHPLHLLAATLAMGAIRDVGCVMIEVWKKQRNRDDVIREALKYLVHPEDIQNTAKDGRAWILKPALQWAKANPKQLQLLQKAAIINRQFTEFEHVQAKLRAHHEKYGEPKELLAQVRGTLERAQGWA
ncbi:hypothetical protein F0U59_03095 [Archangium gephyra]|nr:hypothetical protein F0U59_03095 [Archangium gephyra]